MFSSLSKLADKTFIAGFFLPALLALFATAWAFPELSYLDPLRKLDATDKSITDLVYLALATWIVATMLMMSNYLLYRVLEGYLPPFSWMWFLRQHQVRKFTRLAHRFWELDAEWRRYTASGDVPFPDYKKAEVRALRSELLAKFTFEGGVFASDTLHLNGLEKQILPTRFGNAIRAFESYPWDIYGVDTITMWPRLCMIMPVGSRDVIDNEKSQLDFLVNVSILSFAIFIGSVVKLLHDSSQLHASDLRCLPPNLLVPVVTLTVSLVAYRGAVAQVPAWGAQVMTAFDLFLPSLQQQLGYAFAKHEDDRRSFWKDFSGVTRSRTPMPSSRWPFKSPDAGPDKPESVALPEEDANKSSKEKEDVDGDQGETDQEESVWSGTSDTERSPPLDASQA